MPLTLPDEGARRTQVWLVGFGELALNFELVVWPTADAARRPSSLLAAYAWAIDDALRQADVEIPFQQVDLRLRSLFGREGDQALDALRLDRTASADTQQVGSTPNDALEDAQTEPLAADPQIPTPPTRRTEPPIA